MTWPAMGIRKYKRTKQEIVRGEKQEVGYGISRGLRNARK